MTYPSFTTDAGEVIPDREVKVLASSTVNSRVWMELTAENMDYMLRACEACKFEQPRQAACTRSLPELVSTSVFWRKRAGQDPDDVRSYSLTCSYYVGGRRKEFRRKPAYSDDPDTFLQLVLETVRMVQQHYDQQHQPEPVD